jgi:hypothetical protein
MDKEKLKINRFFSFFSFLLFIVVFCFIYQASSSLIGALSANKNFKIWIFYLGLAAPMFFYLFIADLNNIYNRIQRFFFRDSLLVNVLPSLLFLFGLTYFIIPKIFKITFNKDIFIFLGAAAFMIHLMLVARENKSNNFFSYANYLAVISLLFILNLVLLTLYLSINFKIPFSGILSDSASKGFTLVRNIFSQLTP